MMITHKTWIEIPVEVEIDHYPATTGSHDCPPTPSENTVTDWRICGTHPADHYRLIASKRVTELMGILDHLHVCITRAASTDELDAWRKLGEAYGDMYTFIRQHIKYADTLEDALEDVLADLEDTVIDAAIDEQIASAECYAEDRADFLRDR